MLPDVYELAARNDLDDEAQLSVCVLLSFFGDAESPMKLLKWRQDENQDVRSAVEMLLTAVDPRQVSPDTIRGYMKSAVERAESSVEQLITQLSDVDPLRQLEAIVQLSESIWDPTKNSEIDAAVRPLIESPDAAVQYFATYVQSRMCETTTAVTLLQQAADLPNYSQMLATYRGISDREDAELIPSYVTMLGSPGLQVMARVSLIRIALEHPEEVSTTVMPLTQGEDLEQVLEASIVLAATGLVPNEESLKDVAKRHPCFALFADGNLRSLLQRKKQSRQWQLEEKNSKKRP